MSASRRRRVLRRRAAQAFALLWTVVAAGGSAAAANDPSRSHSVADRAEAPAQPDAASSDDDSPGPAVEDPYVAPGSVRWWRAHLRVEVAARVGYGTGPFSDSGSGSTRYAIDNPLGPGGGGRAGVALFGAYVGVSAMYYGANSAGGAMTPTPVYVEGGYALSSILYGAELGYGLDLWRFTLRPTVGLGNYVLRNKTIFGNGYVTADSLYVEPGVTLQVRWGVLLAGIDVNAFFIPQMAQTRPALTTHAELGVAF